MRPASCLVVLVVLSACGQSQPTAQTSPPASDPTMKITAKDYRLIHISRFDCATSADAEDATEFPWSKGISRWSGGGPGGAAWNVSKLRCAVELQTTCTTGTADIELRIGGALGDSRNARIKHAGPQEVIFELAPDRWEQNLDQKSSLTKRFPYRTATFSASVIASCQAPDVFGPSEGPRLEFADDRHFTAGFASGE